MALELHAILSIQLIILGAALLQLAFSIRKLAAGPFKNMSLWFLLFITFLLVPYIAYIAVASGLLGVNGEYVMAVLMLPAVAFAIAAAASFAKFVQVHNFPPRKFK